MQTTRIRHAKILITGGAGFVGSHIVDQLLPYEPSKVCIVDNLVRGSLQNMSGFIDNPVVEFIDGDIRNKALMEELIGNADYVFHAAALRINACAADQQEAFEVMVQATANIIDSAAKQKVKKVIYSSSASIYGMATVFPTPETHHPYDNQTYYGAAKLFGEQLLRSYHFMHGLDYIALRYFNIFGPRMDLDGKYTEVLIRWLDCINSGKPPKIYGDGCTSMDFVYVEDVARANVLALLSDRTDTVYNIGASQEVSLKELLQTILKVNNAHDLKPEFVEMNTVNPVGRRQADISRAQSELGFEVSTSLEDGIRKLAQWYLSAAQGK